MRSLKLQASKGTLSPHYLGFSLLSVMSVLLGTGLAREANWLYAGLACLGALLVHTIAHCVHDTGHADETYITLPRRGLIALASVLVLGVIALVAYFAVSVSPWALAFAVVIPLVALYRRGLIYSPWCFSGGLAVCVLGGYFVQELGLSLAAVLMALFILLFAQGGIMLYQMDSWMGTAPGHSISEEDYGKAVGYLIIMCLSIAPLVFAVLLR